jgi:hypothetical protein
MKFSSEQTLQQVDWKKSFEFSLLEEIIKFWQCRHLKKSNFYLVIGLKKFTISEFLF